MEGGRALGWGEGRIWRGQWRAGGERAAIAVPRSTLSTSSVGQIQLPTAAFCGASPPRSPAAATCQISFDASLEEGCPFIDEQSIQIQPHIPERSGIDEELSHHRRHATSIPPPPSPKGREEVELGIYNRVAGLRCAKYQLLRHPPSSSSRPPSL